MRILVTIVHHWNPRCRSPCLLRPEREPRQYALQDQLLALRRLDTRQGMLNIATKTVDDANHALRHQFTIKVVTDGSALRVDHLSHVTENCLKRCQRSLQIPSIWGLKRREFLLNISMRNMTYMCI